MKNRLHLIALFLFALCFLYDLVVWGSVESVPEYALHRFFESVGTSYRAYEASDPEALKKAIDAVNRLENLPITYLDTVPRRDLSGPVLALAWACILLLLAAQLAEIRRWA